MPKLFKHVDIMELKDKIEKVLKPLGLCLVHDGASAAHNVVRVGKDGRMLDSKVICIEHVGTHSCQCSRQAFPNVEVFKKHLLSRILRFIWLEGIEFKAIGNIYRGCKSIEEAIVVSDFALDS